MTKTTLAKKIIKSFYFGTREALNYLYNNLSCKLLGTLNSLRKSDLTGKIHFGAGNHLLKGWCNTDMVSSKNVRYLDVRKRMPIDNFSQNYIYCEGMFEHLYLKEGIDFLRECYRILDDDGIIRISTPDLNKMIDVINNPSSHTGFIKYSVGAYNINTTLVNAKLQVFNLFMNGWGHKFTYDYETLKELLMSYGFVEIKRCKVNASNFPELKGVEKAIPFYEDYVLIIEAKKRIKENNQ